MSSTCLFVTGYPSSIYLTNEQYEILCHEKGISEKETFEKTMGWVSALLSSY